MSETPMERVQRMYIEQDMLLDGTHPIQQPIVPLPQRFGIYEISRCGTGSVLHPPSIVIRSENLTIGDHVRVDSFCKLEAGEGMQIGSYVHIASFAHLGIGGGTVQIGNFAAVASHGVLISGSNQADAPSMSACAPSVMQQVKKSFVVLEPYAVVLAGAVVLPGVTLRAGAVLAAGAVATHDVPEWEIWAGVPAKFHSKRVVK